jgi:glycine dehydrogenase subunit 1
MAEHFAYFPHTEKDIREMLERISLSSLDDLYSDVPSDFIYRGDFDLPDALSEQELRDFFAGLAAKCPQKKVLVGQGAYDHYTPAVVEYLCSRSEFLTAYTPYQAEISQGTLRYIFEYQSMICALTGMDVSNASMYDGPTAAAEIVRFCVANTKKRNTVLVSSALLPHVLETLETYTRFSGVELKYIALTDGQTSLESLASLLDDTVAGVLLPQINRFGIIEDHTGVAELVHGAGALLAEYCDPSALAVIKTPAEWGADVAVGDGQPLGIPLCYGGPYVGFMACRTEYMRKLPGRIVGQTVDRNGKRAYVLTLQAREQHIRREKATSNICSNQSLMALWVTVYLSLMGPEGLKRVNELSFSGAHWLKEELLRTGLFEDPFPGKPFLKEFMLKSLIPVEELQKHLWNAGFFAALQTAEGYVDFCVTEKHDAAELQKVVDTVKSIK